ncbi:hypothetical protein SAMN05192558_1265 [Actinokineospora alba]|uniref:Uncharacterized protein n=1 Tax=Actinokineospora alba TaxID=504798 RepID=A0A1H0WND6_9PSEU|nr:hypothetical protein C8E96_2716 [Actinokineospora alba]SDJ54228.1 hypothetical protein SAMN05421871_1205 [Actinokineospora alba]SDP92163.1 hypothetical protein SAMN05192558_1265 [Actinokineospora alba]
MIEYTISDFLGDIVGAALVLLHHENHRTT